MRLLGAILAGGRSSRFGSDKAVALLNDAPLAAHVARALKRHIDALILCGRDEPIAGIGVLPDRPQPGLGPLGGLCAALRHAADHGYAGVLSAACDMPLLPTSLLAELTCRPRAAYVVDAPVLGYWPASSAEELDRHLAEPNDRSIRGWAIRIGADPIETGGIIPNFNRPEDLAAFTRAPGNS